MRAGLKGARSRSLQWGAHLLLVRGRRCLGSYQARRPGYCGPRCGLSRLWMRLHWQLYTSQSALTLNIHAGS